MKLSLFQGIIIAVFIFGAGIGLFIFATYNGSGSGSDAVGNVVVWGTLPRQDMTAAMTEITKQDQTLKSVKYVEKNRQTLPSDLAAAIATGSGPDMILASQEELFDLGPLLQPIPNTTLSTKVFTSSFIDEANILTAANNAGYYGLPFLVDPLVLYWNNDILSSEGIAKPPTTWEALSGLVPNVAILTPSRQISRALIGLGTYDNVRNARAILSSLFLQTQVPIASYSSTGVLGANLGGVGSGTSGQSTGEAVLRFYTLFADPTKVSYTWNSSLPDSLEGFETGDIALYIGFASEAATISAANPNLNYNVAPLPQPGTATTKATYGLLYSFMIARGARNPSGAYQAAALLSNTSEQALAAKFTGLAPASRAALQTIPSDPIPAVAYASALYSRGWLSPAPSSVDRIFSSMISDVISGRLSTASAISQAVGGLNLLYRQ